jgi:NAD+ diphosphatase
MRSSERSRVNAFGALELDRGSERRDDTAALETLSQGLNARFLLMRRDGSALVMPDRSALRELSAEECAPLMIDAPPTFLGSDGDNHRFLLTLDDAIADRAASQSGGIFLDLRQAGALMSANDAGLFAYARGLSFWQNRTRFCANCATPLQLESAGHRAKCTNPQCGIEHFPRTDPAVIVIVCHGDKCLLGRQPSWPERRFSTLAGFVEPGETLEDAVRREVFEESGVRVGECDYHSSQPWPFPASIMLGFTAEAIDPTITLGTELAEAHWFSADELIDGVKSGAIGLSSPISVSYHLIEHWLRSVSGVDLSTIAKEDPIFATKR